jgi:hypothetical protein
MATEQIKYYNTGISDTTFTTKATQPYNSAHYNKAEGTFEFKGLSNSADEFKDTIYYTKEIVNACDEIKNLLVTKNEAYGNSVFQPVKVFGETIPADIAIKARISDKLARIQNKGLSDNTEDTLDDLIGYLILLKIVNKSQSL